MTDKEYKARLKEIMGEVINEDKFREIVEVLYSEAASGKEWAIREVIHQLIGKPKAVTEISFDGTKSLAERTARAKAYMGIIEAEYVIEPVGNQNGDPKSGSRVLALPDAVHP